MLLKRMLCIGIVAVFLSTLALVLPTIPADNFAEPSGVLQEDPVIYPSDDSWVVEELIRNGSWVNASDWVLGNLTYLGVSSCVPDGRDRRTFLKFPLSSISSPEDIVSVRLFLFENGEETKFTGISGVGNVEARVVENDSWTEMNITWNNQPSYGNVADTVYIEFGATRWISWDMTPIVLDELAGDKIISICLKAENENDGDTYRYSYYWSKEYDDLNPHLLVTKRTHVDHDLAVALDAPSFLELGDSSLLNATVTNWGLSNETDVELLLLVDGTIVDSVMIPELLTGSSYTLSYLWTPTVEASYNVTAYAPPVFGENVTANNVATKAVNVWARPEHDLTVALNAPSTLELGDSTLLKATVTNLGSNAETDVELFLLVDGTVVDSAVIPELLTDSSYTLSYLWTPTVEAVYNVTADVPPVSGENITANNVSTKMVDVWVSAPGCEVYVDPGKTTAAVGETFVIDVKVADVANLFGFEYKLFWDPSLVNLTSHATYVPPGWEPPFGFPVKDDLSVPGRHWYAYCSLSGAPFTGDLTLATYTFTVLSQGSCALDIQESKLVDTTATLIPHIADDGHVTCVDAYVEGDVNQDGIVNIVDVVVVGLAFGSEPGDDNWDPRADVANEFGVVNMVDLVTVAIHLGETA